MFEIRNHKTFFELNLENKFSLFNSFADFKISSCLYKISFGNVISILTIYSISKHTSVIQAFL